MTHLVDSTAASNAPPVALPNVRDFGFGDAERRLAADLGIDVSVSINARMVRAIERTNHALRMVVEAGLELLSIRAECEHGEFLAALDAAGMPNQRAYEAMTYAKFAASLPAEERAKVLELPKTKVLALAKADPGVLEDLFADDEAFSDIASLSVRDLRQRIRTLEAAKTDLATKTETLERERDRLREDLRVAREGRVKTGGAVPILVQDIRLECAALHKKALISVEDIGRLASEHLANGLSENAEWNVPVARHVHAALASLYATVGGLMAQMEQTYGPELAGDATVLDTFSPEEATRCALEYRALIAEHEHEKKAREWEREMERPRGVGRPKKRPV
ncbi:hypothetical protein [Cupriavidus gilardii]|uniref:hypothetical protein n=1 Tax=Cupriavidus gilardii TaxID=82541 RepID=UPI001EE563A5|nr:hypothetical protein [Cupriavidus gilardii]MCG5260401.1 hypothetical protein [Cupriavidus gilardii]